MKTPLIIIAACLLSISAAAPKGGGSGGQSAPKAKTPDPVSELLKAYDTSKNGKLDTDELQRMQKLDKKTFDEVIVFDINKDNAVDATELGKWATWKKSKSSPSAPARGNG